MPAAHTRAGSRVWREVAGQAAGVPYRDWPGGACGAQRLGARARGPARACACAFRPRKPALRTRTRPTNARSNPSEDRRGDPLVGHDKERRHAAARLRVKPASPPKRWPRASARPRWPAVAKASIQT